MEIQIREGSREQKRKLKVCAYCRVSTDADEQENSLENQVRHYEDGHNKQIQIMNMPEFTVTLPYRDLKKRDLVYRRCLLMQKKVR